jgi:transcriptional regulator with XRE-family HTH domain
MGKSVEGTIADQSFGTLISRVMKEHNLTQTQLAAWVGCSAPSVGRWLAGNEPTPAMRQRVVTALQSDQPPGDREKPNLGRDGKPKFLVAITGPDAQIKVDVSQPVARKLMQLLLADDL